MERCIFARYTNTSAPDDQHFFRSPTAVIDHAKYVSSDLEWIKDLPNIVRLDISCNYLNNVDLSPLADCQTLKYLDLSENAIQCIDLSPLKSCDKLETLDLSYNRIQDISLTPLVDCKSLRYVYLHRNKLDTINIAPLTHLKRIEKVIIDNLKGSKPIPVYKTDIRDTPPNLNDVLYAMSFQTARPEWLEGCPDVTIIRLAPESYETHVRKHGWRSVRAHLQAALPLLSPTQDFLAQQEILRDLRMPELACYDGSTSDIIAIFPESGTYEEGVQEIQGRLISMLQEQLDNGGSTLFFDIDELSTTPGSVLVPQIVSQRENELKNLILYQFGGRVNLMPMWLTGFGFNILQAAGCGREEPQSVLPHILERSASDIGITIPLKQTKSQKKYKSLRGSPSKALIDHLHTIVPKTSNNYSYT